jgi:hypothetical protein
MEEQCYLTVLGKFPSGGVNAGRHGTRRGVPGSNNGADTFARCARETEIEAYAARSGAEWIRFARGKLCQANVDYWVARHIRVITNTTDPFDSPKKVVGWKIVDCVNRLNHSKIITNPRSSFANNVLRFALILHRAVHIRDEFAN